MRASRGGIGGQFDQRRDQLGRPAGQRRERHRGGKRLGQPHQQVVAAEKMRSFVLDHRGDRGLAQVLVEAVRRHDQSWAPGQAVGERPIVRDPPRRNRTGLTLCHEVQRVPLLALHTSLGAMVPHQRGHELQRDTEQDRGEQQSSDLLDPGRTSVLQRLPALVHEADQ
ncbi:hypothetical protein SK571_30590 [Lentzea sp. BCCO 10_0798]|uniref:Uncharacterized protein n=1 Tax=Lentzea kristufekii TaxID=3095430 RepID=A0ABU4U0T7_9PSEU|nr:hypothetical protein [Lentzea sp. BCCO 10_0798]MDX8053742.1 hypothetical protein [Lentzea sp. BCCO 10_0798]